MKILVSIICSLSLLSGCQLTRVEGEIDGVDVKVSTKSKSAETEQKSFCPPGQTKKGKC